MSLLQGSGLSLRLGGHQILDALDIALQPGELLGLIGPNGAGKSSLLRLLAGLLDADTGSVMLGQHPLPSLSAEERAKRLAWLPQQGEVHWPVTVETLITLGRVPHFETWHKPAERDQAVIARVLRQTDLLQLRRRRFHSLSGGEQARALLARALVTEPNILLADEPVSSLDPAHQLDVMELLQSYCDQGMGVIVVLHDLALAARFCRRLLLLHQGRILANGAAGQVLTAENLERAYHIAVDPEQTGRDGFSHPWQRIRPGPGNNSKH